MRWLFYMAGVQLFSSLEYENSTEIPEGSNQPSFLEISRKYPPPEFNEEQLRCVKTRKHKKKYRGNGGLYSASLFLFLIRSFLSRSRKRMIPISSGAMTRIPPTRKSIRIVVMVSPFHSAIKKIKVILSGLPVGENRTILV